MAVLRPFPSGHFQSPERRLVPRSRVVTSGAAVLTTKRACLPCLVEDLSAGGARLRLGGPLGEASDVRIDIPGGGFVIGACVWTRPGVAGIAFRPGLETLRFFITFALAPRPARHATMAQAPFI